jgi:hypothetical protein
VQGDSRQQVQYSLVMPSTVIPEALFLDTEVFENASFSFKTQQFSSLKRHLSSGRLRLVTTDITVAEIKARIGERVEAATLAHQVFRRNARVLRSSSLADVAATLIDLSPDKIAADLHAALARFMRANDTAVVDTSLQPIGHVFKRYFARTPPFGASKEKRNEFPDAFVVQALADWSRKNKAELFVVSGDVLFIEACREHSALHPKKDLAAVLDHVASDDQKLADFIRAELVSHTGEVASELRSQFQDLGFYVDGEDGDVEMELGEADLSEDPEILEVGNKSATLQVTFDAHYTAGLSYDDSTTGMWDGEDKVMRFMEHRNVDVDGSIELVGHVRVAFSGVSHRAFRLERIDLVEPSSGFGIPPPGHWHGDYQR